MNEPGVYVLYGENDECLYVGSSINMKRRCMQHPHRKLTRRIQYFPCREEQLRDEEERVFKLLSPCLNVSKTISRRHECMAPSVFSVTLKQRIGVSMTADDMRLLRTLKTQIEKKQGKITVSGVIRLALRKLAGK